MGKEPVGFAVEGDVYCIDCVEEEDSENYNPLFEEDEVDSPLHCMNVECEELIDTGLTEEGIEYVLDAIIDYLESGRGREEIIREWWENWREMIIERMERRLGC